MDYRKFLGKQEELILPFLGGPTVAAKGRVLRLETSPERGWWRFSVKGRNATPVVRSDEDLDALEAIPQTRGHLLSGARVVTQDGRVETVHFPPEDEPPLFSPCSARRWHSGQLIFSALDFEDDAEESARQALEDERSLSGIKAVPASLRAAFAYALTERASAELSIPVSPLEVRHAIVALAEGGPPTARAALRQLDLRRRARLLNAANAGRDMLAAAERVSRVLNGWNERTERVYAALDSAGAQLLRSRALAGGQLEVVYRFMGSRFLAVIEERSLRVVDAGVCLDGADRLVTLESLPGVIREAVDTGQLVVTRRVSDDD